MNRQEVDNTLRIPWSKREAMGKTIFPWEHCCKSFYWIPNKLAIKHFLGLSDISDSDDEPLILKCKLDGETYYFGLGLEDEIKVTIIERMFKHGSWSVYTWQD